MPTDAPNPPDRRVVATSPRLSGTDIRPPSSAVVENAASGKSFDNSTYIGTLQNNGVGLSSFHDYASKIPSDLPAKLKAIQTGIENGSIKVASPSSFQK